MKTEDLPAAALKYPNFHQLTGQDHGEPDQQAVDLSDWKLWDLRTLALAPIAVWKMMIFEF